MRLDSMLSTTHPEWARMWESLFDIAGSYTYDIPCYRMPIFEPSKQ